MGRNNKTMGRTSTTRALWRFILTLHCIFYRVMHFHCFTVELEITLHTNLRNIGSPSVTLTFRWVLE